MKKLYYRLFCCCMLIHSFCVGQTRKQWIHPNPQPLEWKNLSTGLDYTEADPHIQCNIGDSKIRILRIDPAHYSLKLMSSKALPHESLTADRWADKYNLTALINAGMYQMDHQTHVSYMRIGDFENQKRFSSDNTLAAFGPKTDELPPVQIIDRTCQDWESLIPQYEYVAQSIRMVDCQQKNRWSQQAKYWSTAAFGVDKSGRALFIISRSPYSVRDFISILQKLPIDLYNAMYLEGGPEASFYVKTEAHQFQCMGSYETGFYESDGNTQFWPIPNIIAVVPKSD